MWILKVDVLGALAVLHTCQVVSRAGLRERVLFIPAGLGMCVAILVLVMFMRKLGG